MLFNPIPQAEKLLSNLLHFGRLLRMAGIPVSSFQIADLARALAYLDLSRKEDVYQASRSLLVHDFSQFDIFERVFNLFWLRYQEWMVEFNRGASSARTLPGEDALVENEQVILGGLSQQLESPEGESLDSNSASSVQGTYSALEILSEKDFAFLTQSEIELARRLIQNLVFDFEHRLTRRKVRALKRAEYIDHRRVLRRNLKHGGEIMELSWSERKEKPRPMIVLCDVSGSMEQYSVLFLHFMHALVQEKQQIETFVFGTRLTYLTPALRYRSVEAVIQQLKGLVLDWSGGTRIGASLREFNYRWSRRMLRRGAVVIIISDGWDRGDIQELQQEIARLHRSVYRLIWLNPLAAQTGYEPLVKGMQAALPYIDVFLPINNLKSFTVLAEHLGSLGKHQPGNTLVRGARK